MSNQRAEGQHIKFANPKVISPLITYSMVHNLECVQERKVALPAVIDEGSTPQGTPSASTLGAGEPKGKEKAAQPEAKYAPNSPCLMILFEDGDVDSVVHHVVDSLGDPFRKGAVATVLIQESVREAFIDRVVNRLKPLDAKVSGHPNYVRTLAKLQALKAETIVGNPKTVPANCSPILVSDLTHNFLGDGPTGVITMHTFRTAKDATVVNAKETLAYGSVSIWNEKTACAYEVCALLRNSVFMFNSYNVDLAPIKESFDAARNDVKIVKGYHYQTLTINQKRKIIVSAIGTIFAN